MSASTTAKAGISSPGDSVAAATAKREVSRLSDLSPEQWRSGVAAWLGWLFDGLDMHLYTLVAAPFVAVLLGVASSTDPNVKEKSAFIQAAFLVGWALGGGFFGRLGDKLGRSRALSLTIVTYACFTGLSFFVTTWWQLMICRFLAALGIGGEWAVGSSLLSETWPSHWRAWIAAILQTGVNIGVLIACGAVYLMADPHVFHALQQIVPSGWHLESNYYLRTVFLIGILPALLVFWIRRHVPEPAEWSKAKAEATAGARPEAGARDASASAVLFYARPPIAEPKMTDLFRGDVRRTTLLTILVCSFSLTGWWAFMFWHVQHLSGLPSLATWTPADKTKLVTSVFFLVIGVSVLGNFFAAWIARWLGYRNTIALMCLMFALAIGGAYYKPRDHTALIPWLPLVGFCSGVFGLFTMYLPPLFPTLLRTTGAGFSYNIGRIAAAVGTIVFGLVLRDRDIDIRVVMLFVALLFIPAAVVALFMPDLRDV